MAWFRAAAAETPVVDDHVCEVMSKSMGRCCQMRASSDLNPQ
jgi:hypothetical protein